MTTQSEDVQLALLIQKVEYLSATVLTLKKEIDDLQSKSLRISGGLAVIVVGGTLITWLVNVASKFKVTLQ